MEKNKNRLMERMEEIINWLYKDNPFFTNLYINIFMMISLIVIKFMLIGFQQKLYSGYFEHMVILVLTLFLTLTTYILNLKASGWGLFSLIFVGIAGICLICYDTMAGFTLAINMTVLLCIGQFLFIIYSLYKNKRKENEKSK